MFNQIVGIFFMGCASAPWIRQNTHVWQSQKLEKNGIFLSETSSQNKYIINYHYTLIYFILFNNYY
jgi:hypothetical protein